MNASLLRDLSMCETDVDGALRRFYGDEDVYIQYLEAFVNEPTMDALGRAVCAEEWREAFVTAHALKGLAGNLGFAPMFYATGDLVVLLRAGRTSEVPAAYAQLRSYYNDVIDAINNNLNVTSKKESES